jgi:hypothetical protein
MKNSHALCRKSFNKSKYNSLLDVNLNIEKLSCGLFDFDLDFLKTVSYSKKYFFKKLKRFFSLGYLNGSYLSRNHDSVRYSK